MADVERDPMTVASLGRLHEVMETVVPDENYPSDHSLGVIRAAIGRLCLIVADQVHQIERLKAEVENLNRRSITSD